MQRQVIDSVSAQQSVSKSRSDPAPFSESFGDYSVLASAVPSSTLPEEARSAHGIPADSDAVLLNVTVRLRGENVRARINATATNLAGQEKEIDMNESVANGFVSYVGLVDIGDSEVLSFDVEVLPEGAQEAHAFEFRQAFAPVPRDGAEGDDGVVP